MLGQNIIHNLRGGFPSIRRLPMRKKTDLGNRAENIYISALLEMTKPWGEISITIIKPMAAKSQSPNMLQQPRRMAIARKQREESNDKHQFQTPDRERVEK
jgi:hypothetical protein